MFVNSRSAVVHKDSEAYHQWSTYWLILHLYLIILSPILNLTLHPIFQIIAILWLSLPQYQGALVVYDRIVNPWVDQYESSVDDAVDEAHRGVRKWIWSRLGEMTWILMGEGGNFAMGVLNFVLLAFYGQTTSTTTDNSSSRNSTIQHSISSGRLAPRHSVKKALSESSSSIEDFGSHSFDGGTDEFVNDFMSMLQQGLYVFANVDNKNEVTYIDAEDEIEYNRYVNRFKLSTFSYTGDDNGAFLLSQVPTGSHDIDASAPIRLPVGSLISLRSNGSRGLILECSVATSISAPESTYTTRAEIVLSDESDREILLSGLNICLPRILPRKQQSG